MNTTTTTTARDLKDGDIFSTTENGTRLRVDKVLGIRDGYVDMYLTMVGHGPMTHIQSYRADAELVRQSAAL